MKKMINKIYRGLKVTLITLAAASISGVSFALPLNSAKQFSASVEVLSTLPNPPTVQLYGLPKGLAIINDIVLTAILESHTGLEYAEFGFRDAFGKFQTEKILLNNKNRHTWQIKIPRGQIEVPGLDYYLEVKGTNGQVTYYNGRPKTEVESLGIISIMVTRTLSGFVGINGGKLIFPDTSPIDGEININFPVMAFNADQEVGLKVLKSPEETSVYGINVPESEKYGIIYEISPVTRELNKSAQMTLLYFDSELIKGVESSLRVFWWDGFEWRLHGGAVDTENKTVTASISKLGLYAVMPLVSGGAKAYMPKERIVTPNNDGINDYANFDGLSGTNTEIKIFDVTGRKIRGIKSAPYRWDGRDEDGRRVENGVYIYQFKVDGELISGVIAVAK